MDNTAIPNVSMWSRWQPGTPPEHAYFIAADEGNIVVDPLPLSDSVAHEIAARGGVKWVVATGGGERRETAELAERFGAEVASPADGEAVGPLVALNIEGTRVPEIALWLRRARAVIAGAAVRGEPVGALRMAPDDAFRDPRNAALSLRTLRALWPQHVLTTAGAPVFGNGYDALNACLAARTDAALNVVNFDELTYLPETIVHQGYGVTSAEVGCLLGASLLGYQTARLPPGESICPLHWHSGDEEVFVVWEGTPVLLSPRGETPLRRGDIVCFVTGPDGAHKIVNRGTGDATILMIANNAPVDACFYPDSRKVLVSPAGVMVRSEPQLKYFDFEP